MNLNLTRPLLFFDIESTGLNIPNDSIIELSFVKVFPDGKEEVKTWKAHGTSPSRLRPWLTASPLPSMLRQTTRCVLR